MFSVDYPTLSQLIRQYLYTGIFRAEVFLSRDTSGRGHIELSVKDGTILACRFISIQGQRQTWDDWETRLAQLGVLDWQLAELPASPTHHSQQSPLDFRSLTPYRKAVAGSFSLDQWPSLHRQVYLLLDGTRNINDIAQLLRKRPEIVLQVIEELRIRDIVQLQ